MSEPRVFMVRPGQNYHLYDAFLRHEALVADAPHLELNDGQPVPKASEISPMLERAVTFRKWGNESSKKREARPPLDLERYSTFLEDRSAKS